MLRLLKATKETDGLAEAYTKIDEIASKLFYDTEVNGDTAHFLRNIASQINLYRAAVFNRKTED